MERAAHGPGRAAGLDGLRGIAAASVLGFHSWLYTRTVVSADRRATVWDFAVHELRLGLVLFFVLSGFLLYRPWIAATLAGKPRPDPLAFLRARARRILPGYYVALAGSIALLWHLRGQPGVRLPPAESLPLFLVFGQNLTAATVMKLDPPMWTLAIEASFYLALPLIGALALRLPGARRAQLAVPGAMIAAGLAWSAAVHAAHLGMPWSKSLPSMLPYFGCGMGAAVLAHGRELGRPLRGRLMIAAVLLVVGDAVVQSCAAAGLLPSGSLATIRDLPAAVGFACLTVAAAAPSPGRRLMAARPLVLLGTVSYGLYLWNVPLLVAARAAGVLPMSTIPAAAAALVAGSVVAAASWRFVERPMLTGRRGRAAAALPAADRGAARPLADPHGRLTTA
jgi:peptidoglycan/LPS O-acetylase OafA/YrhL